MGSCSSKDNPPVVTDSTSLNTQPEIPPDAQPDSRTDSRLDTQPYIQHGNQHDTQQDTQQETQSHTITDTQPESIPNRKPDPPPEDQPDSRTDTRQDTRKDTPLNAQPNPPDNPPEPSQALTQFNTLYKAVLHSQWEQARVVLRSEGAAELLTIKNVTANRNLLHEACRKIAPLDIVKLIVELYPDSVRQVGKLGGTPVNNACRWASEEVALFLLDVAPDTLTVSNIMSRSPLHNAINWRRSPSIIKKVLQIRMNLIDDKDGFGVSPLHLFFWRWEEHLKECIDDLGALPRGEDNDGLEVVKDTFLLLLQATTNRNVDSIGTNWLPLHGALKLGYIPDIFIEFLVKIMPEELKKVDERGNFPLHLAMSRTTNKAPLTDSLETSLDKDDDSTTDPNLEQVIASRIIKRIIDTYPEAIKTPNNDGLVPLLLAVKAGRDLEIVRMVYNAHPNAISYIDTKTSLHPFAVAATTEEKPSPQELQNRLNISFELLMMRPNILQDQ